jgi:hydroxymethylbilane synthase
MKTIRIGTRGSQLALWQATHVSNRLAEIGVRSETCIIKTTGDRRVDVSLATIGGKGLFIKELEEALDRDEVDIAVHSLKDVPSIIPEQFVLASFLERADARDAWIHPERTPFNELGRGAKIGTSSPRRRAQLRLLRPDVEIEDLRGNVETRISKARAGVVDGIVLASAGLLRLGRESDATSFFAVDRMVPAAGQGIVGIETLKSRQDVIDILAGINHAESARAALCERGVLQKFGTLLDCTTSIAVHAAMSDSTIELHAFLSDLEGSRSIRTTRSAPRAEADALVQAMFDELKEKGALEILQTAAVR